MSSVKVLIEDNYCIISSFEEDADEFVKKVGIQHETRSGSVGLKCGFIACSEADLYVHLSPYSSAWDACAPDAILKAAGGVFTDLAGNEFRRVLADPADRPVGEFRQVLVFARPCNRLFRRVDMGDMRPGFRRDKRGDAGIAKQVEHLELPVRGTDARRHVAPVDRLLGKHAHMAKRGEPSEIVDPVMAHGPGLAERDPEAARFQR